MDFKKIKSLEYVRSLEVVDTINYADVVSHRPPIRKVLELNKKLKDKYVSFEARDGMKYRFFIRRVECSIVDDDSYVVFLYPWIEAEKDINIGFRIGTYFQINPLIDIEIYGRKIKSANDPYGEEEWDDD